MHHPLPTHPTRRHPRTGEPLRAVGIGRRGPIWPIIGASEDGAAGGDGSQGADSGDQGTGPTGEETLGDAGKRALAAEREARAAADKRAKAAEAEAERLRNEAKSAEEKALDKARAEGRAEAATKVNTRLVAAEIRAIAAELRFNDPRDAVVQLEKQLAEITVSDDGEVDTEKARELVKSLADQKKYLIAGGTTGSASDAGIGASGAGDNPDPGPGRSRILSAISATNK